MSVRLHRLQRRFRQSQVDAAGYLRGGKLSPKLELFLVSRLRVPIKSIGYFYFPYRSAEPKFTSETFTEKKP
jgi:hypothetical protein